MPLHLVAAAASAAALGAMAEYDDESSAPMKQSEDETEEGRQVSPSPSLRKSNSVHFDDPATGVPSIRSPSILHLKRIGSTMLKTSPSNREEDHSDEYFLDGFVGGDFSSGKVIDIPVEGCFVVAFRPDESRDILAVGTQSGVDFYESTNFSLVSRLKRTDKVSALKWLSLEETGKALLAVAGVDGKVSLYLVEDQILEFPGPTLLHEFDAGDQVQAIDLAFLGVGIDMKLLLVVGDKNGDLTFACYDHDLHHEKTYPVKQCDSAVLGLSLHFDQQNLLATSTKNGDVIVFSFKRDLVDKKFFLLDELWRTQRRGPVYSVIFSKTGDQLAFGGYDKTLALVDTQIWAILREIKLDGTISVITIDPLNRYMAVGSRDKSFTLFDTSTHAPLKRFQTPGWVTSISWGKVNAYQDTIAVRSENTCISFLDLTPIQRSDFLLSPRHGMGESSVSWSRNGRFLARVSGTRVVVSHTRNLFKDVASINIMISMKSSNNEEGKLKDVAFCREEKSQYFLAAVGLDGYLHILKLQSEGSGYFLTLQKSIFVERNLWVVAWSPDGSILATGGQGKKVHLISVEDYSLKIEPIAITGRIWDIEFCPYITKDAGNPSDNPLSISRMTVASGDYTAILFDSDFQPFLQIFRTRTVRCVTYHPKLPHLAIGDGAGTVTIADYDLEDLVKELFVGARINTVNFSPLGDFLVVGTDGCHFTIFETNSYKAVQKIESDGFALTAEFAPNGQFLALGSENDNYSIIRLGSLLAIDFAPLDLKQGVEELPAWALNELLFRSGNGPSLIQRHFLTGNPEILRRVADILHQYPDSLYTVNRSNGEGFFDTALSLRRPNVLKLAITTLVDGTLDTNNDGRESILTTHLPEKARATLSEMISKYSPNLIVDILNSIVFIKVPFTKPRHVRQKMECSCASFMDPWTDYNEDTYDTRRNHKSNPEKIYAERNIALRTPAVLPLPGLGRMDFLTSLLERVPPTVFDNEAMGAVLRVMWRDHIRRYFFIDSFLFLVYFACWIILVDFTSSWSRPPDILNGPLILVTATIFILNTLFVVKEARQSNLGRDPGYIRSGWNINDLLSIICVYIYTLSTICLSTMSGTLVPFAVVTTLLLTMKMMSYLRGFHDTGWLVSVLVQNFHDVRGFLLVLLAVLVGFTTSFRILFADVEGQCQIELEDGNLVQECYSNPFGSISRAFHSTFELTIIGSYDSAILYESRYQALAVLVFIIAITCVLVVTLNALISVLADSYARVQENATANQRKERAELIVEYMSILPKSKRLIIENDTTYFHALLEADADGELLVNKDDWQGGLNALRRDLEELVEDSSERNMKSLDQLKMDLEGQIASFKKDVTSRLKEISHNVRGIKRVHTQGGITFSGKNVAKAVRVVQSVGKQSQEALFGKIET